MGHDPGVPVPYDPATADRLRAAVAPRLPPGARLDEKKMFGGVALMVDRHMCVGVIEDRVVARIGVDAFTDAMELADIGPMDFTGRPMKGWVFLQAPLVADPERLGQWVQAALDFVRSLPAKADKPRKAARKARSR
jgi:hypothetical protein